MNAQRTTATPEDVEREEASFWRALLHRWFIQYNPLYLVSALSVLVGLTLIAHGPPGAPTLDGEVGPGAALAELYAVALLGGAALLTRIRLRRPGVLLALLAVVYQGDLTLLTERSAYLGVLGAFAAAGWLALFVAKLEALAWALRLRLSNGARAVAGTGALALVLLPRLVDGAAPTTGAAVVAAVVFGVFAAGLWSTREITSRVALDAWGTTVLARSRRASWLVLGALFLGHVGFTSAEHHVSALALVPVGLLLATRFARREATVWAAVLAASTFFAVAVPELFWLGASMSACVLGLRALRTPVIDAPRGASRPPIDPPYRASAGAPAPEEPPPEPRLVRAPAAAARRERRRLRRLPGRVERALVGRRVARAPLRARSRAHPRHGAPRLARPRADRRRAAPRRLRAPRGGRAARERALDRARLGRHRALRRLRAPRGVPRRERLAPPARCAPRRPRAR
jgi:hypothetical protein